MERSATKPRPTDATLRCISCGEIQEEFSPDFHCYRCGDLLEAVYPERFSGKNLDGGVELSPDALRSIWLSRKTSAAPEDRSGVWRFRELLPRVPAQQIVTLAEGNTPIYEMPKCARIAGVGRLLAKHQGMNPTGSFKDTGMTVALSIAKDQGFQWVGCASTGNTSASMAAYAARANLKSLVLIPEGKIAWGKLSQSLEYGALTVQLKTDFDGCFKLLQEIAQRYPIYLLNSINPYRLEGQKTAAVEMLEQLGWTVPDHVIVPGGNLANSSALGKGLLELHELRLISTVPRVSIIQARGANALVRTMREKGGRELVAVKAETMATAIRIGNPASWKKAVAVLNATQGTCEEVSEEEIAVGKAEIGAEGIGCEPAAAVTLAGLKKLVRTGFVRLHELVVLVLTGHLLKDPEYTLNFHRGGLFSSESIGEEAQREFEKLRKPPLVLPAEPDAVIAALEGAK
jgi:threonine synthase